MNEITHADLLEIAGYWVYEELDIDAEDTKININNTMYDVLDIDPEEPQAMTLLNCDTNEVIIAYQGTDFSKPVDVCVDAMLAINMEHTQFTKIEAYYQKIQNEIIMYNQQVPVEQQRVLKYIVGNSLAGSYANYILMQHPDADLTSVTLDPAPLPVVKNDVPINAYNYITNTAPLHKASLAADFVPHRFGGTFIYTQFGVFSFADIASNHTGYVRDNLKIKKGLGVDDFIPFSIWNNELLSATTLQTSRTIDINYESLQQLAHVMRTRFGDIKDYLQYKLNLIQELMQTEEETFFIRKESAQTKLIAGLTAPIQYVTSGIENLQYVQTKLQTFEGTTFVLPFGVSETIKVLYTFIGKQTDTLLIDSERGENDAFVKKIIRHQQIIYQNWQKIFTHWETLETITEKVATTFQTVDEYVLTAPSIIANQNIQSIKMNGLDRQTNLSQTLMSSPDFTTLKSAIQTKKDHVEKAFQLLNSNIRFIFNTLIHNLNKVVKIAQKATTCLIQEKQFYYQTKKISWQTIITGVEIALQPAYQTLWEQQKQELSAEIEQLKFLEEILENTHAFFKKAPEMLPELLLQFKEYLVQFIFHDTIFGDIQRNTAELVMITQNSQLVFQDIVQQLSQNQSQSITNLTTASQQIVEAFTQIIEQMQVFLF